MSGVKRMIVSTDNYAPLGAMTTAGKEDDQFRSRVYIYIYIRDLHMKGHYIGVLSMTSMQLTIVDHFQAHSRKGIKWFP